MNEKLVINAVAVGIILFVLLAGQLVQPSRQSLTYISTYGFIALLCLLLILSLPYLSKALQHKIILSAYKNRRLIGIWTFLFALIHVVLVLNFILKWDVLPLFTNPNYIFLTLGFVAFCLLFLMAITSNDFSVKLLGAKWKSLHRVIFIALVLILIHFLNVGKIFAKEPVLAFGVVAISLLVILSRLCLTCKILKI
ncbi:MAG: ferric reductase-like transmembrane domain-containing protein [Candidatus Anstonellales archaeon]